MFNDPRFLAVLFLFCTSRDFRNLAVLIRSKTADFYHPPMKLGKVMFSVMSICPQGGGSPCNHHALDLTVKASPTHPPSSDMGPHWWGTPVTWEFIGPHQTGTSSLLVTSGSHHWRPVQTCPFQEQSLNQCWHLVATKARMVDASGWYASYWNAFLWLIVLHCFDRQHYLLGWSIH